MRPLPGALDVVSRKSYTGSKGYPFLGSARGAKEAVDLFTRRKIVGDERGRRKRNKHTKTQRSTQVQAARRQTALLLHVWIDIIMLDSYKGVLHADPEGYRLELEDEQILPWGDHLSSPPPTLV